MSDVARKIITGNDVRHHGIIYRVSKGGIVERKNETYPNSTDPSADFGRLDNRFDDPRYYSGDTAA